MPEIGFYRQLRADGGLRTGLTLDRQVVGNAFVSADRDDDPALIWYVDVVYQSRQLPGNADEVKKWFIDHSDAISAELKRIADELRVGVDPDVWPVRRKLDNLQRAKGTVTISAIRRLSVGELGRAIESVARRFASIVRSVETNAAAV